MRVRSLKNLVDLRGYSWGMKLKSVVVGRNQVSSFFLDLFCFWI